MRQRRLWLTAAIAIALTACGSAPADRHVGAAPSSPPGSTATSVDSASSSPSSPSAPTTSTLPPATMDDRVYVLGDSVLLGTVQTLPAALVGWRVTMDCVGSRRLTQGIADLRKNRGRIGSVIVLQMGNNFIPGEDGTFASQIDQAMRVLQGVRRVVWVTVAEKWPDRVPLNRDIRAAAARWPTIRIADWAPVIATHPSYAYDMLHLTELGRVRMARLIAAAVGPAPH